MKPVTTILAQKAPVEQAGQIVVAAAIYGSAHPERENTGSSLE
jgi:hypothetical protein